ncbi:MAG: glycosyltransferase family 4 protein [Isosphaeraceae bacterium]
MIVHSFDYPPMHGGIARLCGEIAGGMRRRGQPVRVVTQAGDGKSGMLVPEVAELRVTASRPRREWQALGRLRQSGRSESPVICGTWYPEGLLALLAGSRPVVILAHGNELLPVPSRWRRAAWARLARAVLGSADLIVANSDYTAGLVRTAAPRSRVISIPLAADHRRFTPGDRLAARRQLGLDDNLRVIVTVARLLAYKGHDVVFRALTLLPDDVRGRFVHIVAGRGPDRERLGTEARRLGVADRVRWLGFVGEADLPELYRAADLFALCTRATDRREVEGFGLALLEAQACGTPVVGTASGGIPDAVAPGEGGWLIEPDDYRALADLLRRLDDDPAKFRRAGDAARARVEREGTWDSYLDRFEATLRAEGLLT